MSSKRQAARTRRSRPGQQRTGRYPPLTRVPSQVVAVPRWRIGGTLVMASRLASAALMPAALAVPALASSPVPAGSTADGADAGPVHGDPQAPVPARLTVDLKVGGATVGASGFTPVYGPLGAFFGVTADPSGKYGALIQGGPGLTYGWAVGAGLTSPPTVVPMGDWAPGWGIGGGVVGIVQTQSTGVTMKYNISDSTGALVIAQDFKPLVPAAPAAGIAAAGTAEADAAAAGSAAASQPMFGWGAAGALAISTHQTNGTVDAFNFTPGLSGWMSSPTPVQAFAGPFLAIGVPQSVTSVTGAASTWVNDNVAYHPATDSAPSSGYIIFGQPPGLSQPSFDRDLAVVQGFAGAVSNAYSTVKGWFGYPDQAAQSPAPAPTAGDSGNQVTAAGMPGTDLGWLATVGTLTPGQAVPTANTDLTGPGGQDSFSARFAGTTVPPWWSTGTANMPAWATTDPTSPLPGVASSVPSGQPVVPWAPVATAPQPWPAAAPAQQPQAQVQQPAAQVPQQQALPGQAPASVPAAPAPGQQSSSLTTQPDLTLAQQQGDGTGQDTSTTSITAAVDDPTTTNTGVASDAQGSQSFVVAGSDSVEPSGMVTS